MFTPCNVDHDPKARFPATYSGEVWLLLACELPELRPSKGAKICNMFAGCCLVNAYKRDPAGNCPKIFFPLIMVYHGCREKWKHLLD